MQFSTNLVNRGVNILYDIDSIDMLDNRTTHPHCKNPSSRQWFDFNEQGVDREQVNPTLIYTSQETFYTSQVKIKMIIMNDLPKQVIRTSPSKILRGNKSKFSRIFLMDVRSC